MWADLLHLGSYVYSSQILEQCKSDKGAIKLAYEAAIDVVHDWEQSGIRPDVGFVAAVILVVHILNEYEQHENRKLQ